MTRRLVFSNEQNSEEIITSKNETHITSNSKSNILDKAIFELKTKTPKKIVTTFEELANLKAGYRYPIDIKNPPQSLTNVQTSSTSSSQNSMFKSSITQSRCSLHLPVPNNDLSAFKFTSLSNQTSTVNIIDNAKTILNSQNNRRYFSLITNNKLFNEFNKSSQELRLKIVNNQLINELDEENLQESQQDLVKQGCMSSTSSNSGSDSGCGSSIARSSILSTTDIDLSPKSSLEELSENFRKLDLTNKINENVVKPDTNKEDEEDIKMKIKTKCEKFYNKMKKTKSNFDLNKNESVDDACIKSNKNVNKKARHSAIGTENHQTDILFNQSKPLNKKKEKILTVLFDYNTDYLNGMKKRGFSLKKGETVKVIRDYDETYYLVATTNSGEIGFVPKEYTVDMKEIRHRYKKNLKQQKMQQPVNDSYISDSNSTNVFNLKLTRL